MTDGDRDQILTWLRDLFADEPELVAKAENMPDESLQAYYDGAVEALRAQQRRSG
jgi:hypothetical protein